MKDEVCIQKILKKPSPGGAELIMAGISGSTEAPVRKLPMRNKATQF